MVQYTYLGLATIVQQVQGNGVTLSYIHQSFESSPPVAGTPTSGGMKSDYSDNRYTGLDRFGRVVDQYWYVTGGSPLIADYRYAYDADGNVLWRNDLSTSSTTQSEAYTYDGLNRLTSFSRGTLNTSTGTINAGTATTTESWSLDALGNWSSVTLNSGSPTSNTTNYKNEETGVGSGSQTYDNNGNVTDDSGSGSYVYDAWNRQIPYSSGTTYNALGEIATTADSTSDSITVDRYYTASGQLIEWDGCYWNINASWFNRVGRQNGG